MASPVDPFVAGVILAMSAVTYATKAGGLWLLGRVEVPERVETGLELLPGAIIVSILAPELIDAGPAEWGAGTVVVVVMWRSGNILLSLLCGVGAVLLLRTAV
ncbi:AzlD family protein [Haloplanus litoreus]|uniref:AzlD family protein n=1 Tax=Haloplanus litoreus TaxID=767515 RepID=A0ABD5ZU93_9EURY